MSDFGKIIISPEVVNDIVVEATKDIKGVYGVSEKGSKSEALNFFSSSKAKKSIEVEMGETECVIDISISIKFGEKINDVAVEVQKNISTEVEKYTGLQVREVNVTVKNIVKEEKETIKDGLEESEIL